MKEKISNISRLCSFLGGGGGGGGGHLVCGYNGLNKVGDTDSPP